MPPREEQLKDLLDELFGILTNDPGALDPTDPRRVPNLHGKDAEDVVLSLQRACERVEGSAVFYFTGQRGTGKSTELKRLATLLSGSKSKAFMVDALDYISDSHPLQLIDLLLVIALAFADKLREDTGEEFLNESVTQRFAQWLQTDVGLAEFGVMGAKLTFKQQQQSLINRIRAFDLARQEKFVNECRQFITELARFARSRFQRDRTVLIVDSLERLRGIGAAATEMFDHVVKVFDGGIDALRINELQVIYSVPPYLPYLSNVRNLVRVFALASVRVCEPPTRARRKLRTSGVEAMRGIVERRCARWKEVLAPAALDRLIVQSGGDMRQLLRRFLVDVLDQAYFALDRLPLKDGDEIVNTVLDRHRVEFEQMVVRDEYALLKLIAEQNAVDLQKREELPVVARFFDIRAVLSYRNAVEWVDLNPLLWTLIDQYTPLQDAPA